MDDQSKKLKNPLFSAFVTGTTLEDYSQNAILLPAKEKPPPSSLKISQEQLLNEILSNPLKSPDDSSRSSEPGPSSEFSTKDLPAAQTAPPFAQDLPDISTLQPHLAPTAANTSHLSSVFSSFSNILSLGGSSTKEPVPVPPPAGIDTFIQQPAINPDPVPLFSADSAQFLQQKPPTTSETSNQFRRGGLKRPTYAPVPGLSGTAPAPAAPAPPVIAPPQPAPYFTSAFFTPSIDSVVTSSAQIHQHPFRPLSAPSPVAHFQSNFGQEAAPSPVMDAISPSELGRDNGRIDSASNSSTGGAESEQARAPVNQVYRPVYHHWFFEKGGQEKKSWQPFSMVDSLALEHAFTSNDLDPEKVIATDGGRYDVNILRRQRSAVYWKSEPTEVRRCSWFHKNSSDGRLLPYEENVAATLEEEYKVAFESNQWHRKIELPNGETVVLHGPDVLVLFSQSQVPDAWGNSTTQPRPRVVKRGMDEFDIDEGEPARVDHILFMVHGIGSVCDLKFRTVEEVVDEFRGIAYQLVQSHYRTSCEAGAVHRVEVLPISWHDRLHSEETGIDDQLDRITLSSVPTLRKFTNDTLLDILFYTSPVYCQKIISTVGSELNRIYDLFKMRNPEFSGGVSLGGHSLGSLILFDLLCHQDSKVETDSEESDDLTSEKPAPQDRKMSKRISYMMGAIGTGQPQIHYTRLNFEPKNFFALGSPIGMFIIVRGLDTLGDNFSLPTCPAFYNIFHPHDPIAYRIESLINPELGQLNPVLIPHHKGRKRMHLELKETMARVGADLKQKVFDSMKNTWNSVYQLAMFHKQTPPPNLEEEVASAYNEQIEVKDEPEQVEDTAGINLGTLNGGRRIDYVLQEAPFEVLTEYFFALKSHVCYWESEDTILMILKEIYTSMGVTSDSQIPQQSMTIERAAPSFENNSLYGAGVDPTRPMQLPGNIQPPPMAGFVKKT
ncbi:unnamed protein product [Phyllotreta striolata]|uniref:Uncharacterized protein n=1 Tax=Phyllotreta striolata TaxID=444603 RepID=A0A9N9XKI2_PHYSR|nr:unnamed protein product [Phyllotreta striolata]